MSTLDSGVRRLGYVVLTIAAFAAISVALLAGYRSGSSLSLGSADEPEARRVARNMYHDLMVTSCTPAPDVSPETFFVDERRLVRRLEKPEDSPLASQLRIAKADAALFIDVQRSCAADSEPWYPRARIESSRKEIRPAVTQLEAMAKRGQLRQLETTLASEHAAAYRMEVRDLVWQVNPLCEISVNAGNDDVVAPARSSMREYKRSLRNTPYGLQFEIAEADASYEISMTMVECANPGTESLRELQSQHSQDVSERLKRLRALQAKGA